MKRYLRALTTKIVSGSRRRDDTEADVLALVASAIDVTFYSAQLKNPVEMSAVEAARHYLMEGAAVDFDPRPDFSTIGYLEDHNDVKLAGVNPLVHYLQHGRIERRITRLSSRARPVQAQFDFHIDVALSIVRGELDQAFYLEQVGRTWPSTLVIDPARHYINVGSSHDLDPSPIFSTKAHKARFPDVDWSRNNPLVHWAVNRILDRPESDRPPREVIDPADFEPWVLNHFDSLYYLEQNPDVKQAGVDPAFHFFNEGWRELRDPSASFSVAYYLAKYDDVNRAGINPLLHFIHEGRSEGRFGSQAAENTDQMKLIGEEFDREYYLRKNPDVRDAGVDPFQHFMGDGWREGRNPSARFSVGDYLRDNPDVAASDLNPLAHFISQGRAEGRLPLAAGGFRAAILRNQLIFDEILPAITHDIVPENNDPNVVAEALKSTVLKDDIYLTISHDNFTSNTGGVQLCIALEGIEAERRDWTHIHLFPPRARPYIADKPGLLGVVVDGETLGFCSPHEIEAFLESGADSNRYVAIHSLLGHQFSDIVRILDTFTPHRMFFWLHDYASLCSGYNLLRNNIAFCGAPPADSMACQICIYGSTRDRQHQVHKELLLRYAPTVLSPSPFAANLWSSSFDSAIVPVIIPHCTLVPSVSGDAVSEARAGDKRIKVAFLGWPVAHKGWAVFERIVEEEYSGGRYAFYHFGGSPDPTLPVEFVHVTANAANPTAMVDALIEHEIDYALIWSLWPETFCFTAHEAVASGAIIITNVDAGNVAELARKTEGAVFENEESLRAAFKNGAFVKQSREKYASRMSRVEYGHFTLSQIEHG